MKQKHKKYVVEKLINDTVNSNKCNLSGPAPDEGLIYRNGDLCWYPKERNLKVNKTESDKLESLL